MCLLDGSKVLEVSKVHNKCRLKDSQTGRLRQAHKRGLLRAVTKARAVMMATFDYGVVGAASDIGDPMMADSDKTVAPAWQQAAESPASEASATESTSSRTTTIEQARRFLSDETVQNSTREKKEEFLKSKGLGDEDIRALLDEQSSQIESSTSDAKPTAPEDSKQVVVAASPSQPSAPPPSSAPPIITYPEFLTHSPRSPPLVTPTGVLNLLAAAATTLTALYGAANYIVSPMVDNLTEARSDYYDHVNIKLSGLVERLEGVVSEVPYKNGSLLKSEVNFEDDSSYDDPTELFHRDVGTQTSPQALSPPPLGFEEKPIDSQSRCLAELTASLKDLTDTYTRQSENTADLNSALRGIRDEVDKLGYQPLSDYSTLYGGSGFGISRSATDSEDEIKKTKDAIRSVKGMFLSSRMFPAAATR
ncbi:peroxisomal membrane anchor protein conserved region-domain-containing protein [Xylariales sp. PMI_506]|nr:peroxisomal membrane anchor protein conserved region-domain-containing protein [Xylariales sp. PMI_506]